MNLLQGADTEPLGRQLVLFTVSFDYARHVLDVRPLRSQDHDWLGVNQDFTTAALKLIYAEFEGRPIRRGPNDPNLMRICNRFCDVLRAAYPHADFSAVLQHPAISCHC